MGFDSFIFFGEACLFCFTDFLLHASPYFKLSSIKERLTVHTTCRLAVRRGSVGSVIEGREGGKKRLALTDVRRSYPKDTLFGCLTVLAFRDLLFLQKPGVLFCYWASSLVSGQPITEGCKGRKKLVTQTSSIFPSELGCRGEVDSDRN